jgi:FAD/FMN-containing dehydrogenase
MHSSTYLTLDGDVRQMRQADIDALSGRISGGLLGRGDKGYDDARKVWNATVDHRPALIARCMSDADVQAAVRFAGEQRMRLSVRGGGHHIAGNAVVEGGLTIDLSGWRSVAVDAARRTARVAPGALLADFDREAQAHGLATPLGINSTTGVAGLTLGGGFGWLTRSFGLTVDNLLGVSLVAADGTLHQVSATSEPELFWALRGGGGNFGVVTSFEFRLHPVGPEVWSGLVVYAGAQARQVLRAWRDFNAGAPEALSVWAVLRKAPPLPFIPAEHHGRDVVIFPLLYAGDMAAGEKAAAPVATFATPIGTHLGPTPYAGFQQAFDPLLTPGGRNYWKSNNFASLSDTAIDLVIEAAKAEPGPECEVFLAQLGGAMARVDPAATAFVGRDAAYIMNVHGRWADTADDKRVRDWARKVFTDSAPHATGGGYVNFLTEDEGERVAATYGANYTRLQAVKQRYDPTNLFRANLNIAPQAGG